MCFFVQTNHTRKELLFLMFKEINLRNHSSLHKLFYSLGFDLQCGLKTRYKDFFFDRYGVNLVAERLKVEDNNSENIQFSKYQI